MTDTPTWTFEATFENESQVTADVPAETCLEATVEALELLHKIDRDDAVVTKLSWKAHDIVRFAGPDRLSVLSATSESCPYLPRRVSKLTEKQLRLVHDEHLDKLQY